VHVVLCRSPRPRLIGRALASSADCPGALRPWPGGWPLPAAGGRRHHCGRRPTKPVFCSQSEDKAKRTLAGTASLRLLPKPVDATAATETCTCFRKSTGSARDFRVTASTKS